MPDTDWYEDKAMEEGRLSALDGGKRELHYPPKPIASLLQPQRLQRLPK